VIKKSFRAYIIFQQFETIIYQNVCEEEPALQQDFSSENSFEKQKQPFRIRSKSPADTVGLLFTTWIQV